MADINLGYTGVQTTGHPSRRGRKVPYMVRRTISGAEAVAAKGGALAEGDTIEVFDIPAHTVVMGAGWQVKTGDTGSAAPATLTMGSANLLVGGNLASAGYNYSQSPGAIQDVADTLDVTLGELVDANDDWVMDVFAVIVDASEYAPVQSSFKADNIPHN